MVGGCVREFIYIEQVGERVSVKGFVYMYMYIPFSVPFNIYTHEFFSQRSATHTALLPRFVRFVSFRFAPTVSACTLTPYLDKNTPSTYIHTPRRTPTPSETSAARIPRLWRLRGMRDIHSYGTLKSGTVCT